jgi:hypothetical protein
MSFVYHGLSEIVIRLANADALVAYRPERRYADKGAFVVGVALLVMTLGYLATHPPASLSETVDRKRLARIFDWRLTGLLTLPLLLATTQGAGYNNGRPLQGEGISTAGLALEFLVPLLVLTSFGYLLRHPDRFVLVIAVQSAAMALAGQRLEVLVTVGVLWLMARRVGLGPTRRQMGLTAVAAVVLVVGITSVRSTVGREQFYGNTGGMSRLSAIAQGVENPQYVGVTTDNPLVDAALRFDGNAWSGGIMQSFDAGRDPIGVAPVYYSALSTVPSVLFPSKVTDLSLLQRSAEMWQITDLRLPVVDYLPGHVVFFLGALGMWGLLLFNFLIGLALGLAESRALRSPGPVAIYALLLLTQSALFFERGLPLYLLAGRAFLVVGAVIWLWSKITAPKPAQSRSAADDHPGQAT